MSARVEPRPAPAGAVRLDRPGATGPGLQRQTQVGEQVLGGGEEHHVGGTPGGTQGGLPVAAGQLTRVRHDQRRAVEVLPQQRGLRADDVDGDPVLLEHAGDGAGPVGLGVLGVQRLRALLLSRGDQREDRRGHDDQQRPQRGDDPPGQPAPGPAVAPGGGAGG